MLHRITSLERWGMRSSIDFTPEGLEMVKKAGFTGIFANGGSGIGPDLVSPESMLITQAIPDLMPLTARSNISLMEKQIRMIEDAGLKTWLTLWGIPGPDQSHGSNFADSNRFFERRTKLEMRACMERHPEYFSFRKPTALSWRGSRPLCASHPKIQEFYRELYRELPLHYPSLEGIFFFPGDHDPEICDTTCPRCSASGRDPWGVIIDHVNLIYSALQESRPGFPFYFSIWNQDHPHGKENIQRFLDELHPGIGICMSQSDNIEQKRRANTTMLFNQPWSLMPEVGDLFRSTANTCFLQKRPVMVFAEISQSEVWDPVCHNFPLPGKIISFLKNADSVNGVDAVHDFWGHRSPFVPHANHAAMQSYFLNPTESQKNLLRQAATIHYGLTPGVHEDLVDQAVAAWQLIEEAVDDWVLTAWAQRFSFAIGRDAARGRFYQALIPSYLREVKDFWGVRIMLQNGTLDSDLFSRYQNEDGLHFISVAENLKKLSRQFESHDLRESSATSRREALTVELAGKLIPSIGRTIAAGFAYEAKEWSKLRSIIISEIDSREEQLELSGKIGYGGGVHPLLVSEDIQNMRLYVSHPSYPHVPDECFHFTPSPYST